MLKHLYVLLVITVSFVLFDAASVRQAGRTIAAMFSRRPFADAVSLYYLRSYAVVFVLAAVGATPLPARLARRVAATRGGNRALTVAEPLALLALLAVVTAFLVDGSFNPFLYFRF